MLGVLKRLLRIKQKKKTLQDVNMHRVKRRGRGANAKHSTSGKTQHGKEEDECWRQCKQHQHQHHHMKTKVFFQCPNP